ncbi:unnamed protein product [Caenorhabditis angaria]|uniref:Uncharacterized protein n=1 Tax=Caenorhabditis angaria TaxID=860376 RepID=A0A9P1IEI4_9PELO|nr:unnamed protein product [Caenorhabditis angaria]
MEFFEDEFWYVGNPIIEISYIIPSLIFCAILACKIYSKNEILVENRTRIIVFEFWLVNFLSILNKILDIFCKIKDTYTFYEDDSISEKITSFSFVSDILFQKSSSIYLEIAIFFQISRENIAKKYSDLPTYPNIVIFLALIYFSYSLGPVFSYCVDTKYDFKYETHKIYMHPLLEILCTLFYGSPDCFTDDSNNYRSFYISIF